jgi:glutaredoxin
MNPLAIRQSNNPLTIKTIKPLFILLLFITNLSIAEIFKWTDKNGVIHYSENKPEKESVEEFQLKSYQQVTIERVEEPANTDQNQEQKDQKPKRSRPKKVVMYSAEWCGVGKTAKAYFKKNRIRYTSYDVEKNAAARKRYKKMGAKGVPVIFIGKQRMNGFNASGFDQIYNN